MYCISFLLINRLLVGVNLREGVVCCEAQDRGIVGEGEGIYFLLADFEGEGGGDNNFVVCCGGVNPMFF